MRAQQLSYRNSRDLKRKCARRKAGALCICLYESFVVSRSSSMFAPAAASVESVCAASCETIKSCGTFVC